jgi:hypothetical protein
MRTRILDILLVLIALPITASADRAIGQADLPLSLSCPYAGGAGPFVDSGIALTLETKAGAVFITGSFDIGLSPNAGFLMRPTIDGAAADGAFANHFIGGAQGEQTTLSFSRACEVTAGLHTFRLQFSCQGNVSARAGWLTVFQVH